MPRFYTKDAQPSELERTKTTYWIGIVRWPLNFGFVFLVIAIDCVSDHDQDGDKDNDYSELNDRDDESDCDDQLLEKRDDQEDQTDDCATARYC